MQREYAFLSHMIPEDMRESVYNNSRNSMQDAADALQWHIYNGLCENLECAIKIFNFLPIHSYPQFYRKAFIKRSVFCSKYNDRNENIGFCNIKLIRSCSKYVHAYKSLKKWLDSNNKPKTLFMYTASGAFLKAIARLKKEYDFRVCVIIADLPDMRSLSSKKGILRQCYEKWGANNVYSLLSLADYYVLLTKYMAEYLKIDKPYCVMEGISTAAHEFSTPDHSGDIKRIFYAGTLHRRFGVLRLLEAFRMIKGSMYRLILCGAGDSEAEIKEAAKKDNRIIFLGQLPRRDVLKLQSSATVFVNPRQNNEEFTKYSFPSKNLEYLSSGVPLVAYKLDGIPDEYDEHIFYVGDDSSTALADKLREVCETSPAELVEHCKRAREFVQQEKNELLQTKKIVDLIRT